MIVKFGDSKNVVAELHMDRVHFDWMLSMLESTDSFRNDEMRQEWLKAQRLIDDPTSVDVRFDMS